MSPLPEPAYMTPVDGVLFNAEQMHAHAAAAVAAERERCARLCDIVAGCCADRLESRAATRCAGAIRGS